VVGSSEHPAHRLARDIPIGRTALHGHCSEPVGHRIGIVSGTDGISVTVPAQDRASYAVAAVTRDRPALRALVVVALLSAVGVVSAPAVAAAPQVPDEVARRLDTHIDTWRANRQAPGVAAAVRFPDGTLWIGTSGRASVGADGRALTTRTPFAVASLTKTFIAALVLQLVEQGRLSLGDRLSRWMPDYPRAKAITVRMLLNHRSGIFDYFAHSTYERRVFGRPRHHWSVPEILSLRGPRYCDPDACFRYSNTNYILLGRIIREVTGKEPARLIRNRFLGPLGLEETFLQGQEGIGRWGAKGYWLRPGGYRDWSDGTAFRPSTSAATVAESAGAMLASVRDISDWQDALFGGAVLSAESLERMLAFHPKSGYGLGMRRAVLDGHPAIGHGGSLRGYVAIMYRLPDHDIDVVILTNLGNAALQPLADRLARVALRTIPDEDPA
jgi:D-alanyl-D-alanine carboxypeptidase